MYSASRVLEKEATEGKVLFLQRLANGLVEVELQQDFWWRRNMLCCSLGGTYAFTHFLILPAVFDFSCQAAVELPFPELGFAEEVQLTYFPLGQVLRLGNGFHDSRDLFCQCCQSVYNAKFGVCPTCATRQTRKN